MGVSGSYTGVGESPLPSRTASDRNRTPRSHRVPSCAEHSRSRELVTRSLTAVRNRPLRHFIRFKEPFESTESTYQYRLYHRLGPSSRPTLRPSIHGQIPPRCRRQAPTYHIDNRHVARPVHAARSTPCRERCHWSAPLGMSRQTPNRSIIDNDLRTTIGIGT